MSSTEGKRQGDRWLIISAACVAAAAVILVAQIAMGNPNYAAAYPWNVYIGAFFAFVACGTGLFIVGGSMRVFGYIDACDYRKLALVAFGCFAAASVYVTADAGVPWKVPMLAIVSNFGAPILTDFWVVIACLVVSACGAFLKKDGKVVPAIGVVAGFLLLGVEAWLVESSVAQELLSVTMSANAAVMQALCCGVAMVLLVVAKHGEVLKKILMAGLSLFAIISVIDVLAGVEAIDRMGRMWAALGCSPLFWVGLVVSCVVPVAVLLRKADWAPVALVCVPVGTFLLKLSYLWASQGVAPQAFMASGSPEVSVFELLVTLGMAFLPVLLWKLGKGRLALDEKGCE